MRKKKAEIKGVIYMNHLYNENIQHVKRNLKFYVHKTEEKELPYLLPMSFGVTFASSTMVIAPTPGRTRDFSVSVPVALALMRQIFAHSSEAWPWSPQSLGIVV